MPDVPAVPPEKTPTPAPSAVPAPAAAPAPAQPAAVKKAQPEQTRSGIDDPLDEEPAAPGPPKKHPALVLTLGLLSAFLLIVAVLLWFGLNARTAELAQTQNRLDQLAAGTDKLQAQVTDAGTGAVAQQKQTDEAKTAAKQAKAEQVKAEAATAELQILLTKARADAVAFQAQAGQAGVAALKSQGEAELARTESAVMQTQLTAAQADLKNVQAQLATAKAAADDLQAKLAKAETEISALKKSPPKK